MSRESDEPERRVSDEPEHLARTWLADMGVATAETIAVRPQKTITPREQPAEVGEPARALALLERLSAGESRLQLGQTIGQGGMGVVVAAEQLALGRTVAVKTLRPETRTGEAATALLREAWITGSLEHPNVVPVHDIGLDQDGNPMIVLKRIEGESWSQLMHDADAVRVRFGNADLLAFNLEIFGQVCNAIRFAHNRGILHRDIKPDNVMIGEFGEVYVLDWGIAVSLREPEGEPDGRLPLARDATAMAGSPFYMAPEMLGRGEGTLSERTDIYLLGSLIYEIMAGRPPHRHQGGALAILRSVALSQPDMPGDAPEYLVRICRRAMARDPDDRYQTVDQLRVEVARFLQHRGSASLVAKAEHDLDELSALLERGRPPDDEDDGAWRQNLYRLFGACRFGFQEALTTWPENRTAAAGLERALTCMAEHELASGHPRAAEAILAELAHVPEDLRRRIDQGLRDEQQRSARMAELERLSADLDPAVGLSARAGVSLLVAGSMVALPLAAEWLGLLPAVTYTMVFAITLGFLVLMGGLYLRAARTMPWTSLNRRILGSMFMIVVAQLLVELGFWLMDANVLFAIVFLLLLWAFDMTLLALTVEVALWPMGAGFAVAFLVAAWRPEWVLYCIAGGNLVVVITALVLPRRIQAAR